MSRIFALSASICALALILRAPALALGQAGRVGELTCDTGPRAGFLVGSRQTITCVFRAHTGHQYNYTGKTTRLGLNVGTPEGGRLFWAVFAPTSDFGPGAMRGDFVRAIIGFYRKFA
jgi:Protein of unknown function (DUF992)